MAMKKKATYEFLDGHIKIVDPDLGLEIEAQASDIVIPKQFEESALGSKGAALRLEKSNEGHIQSAYTEVDGQIHGQWALYYKQGLNKSLAHYYKGKLHGPSFFYSESGTLLSSTWFIHGKRIGHAKQYYLSGDLYSSRRYFDNQLEGKQEYYYENGNIKTLMNYEKGQQVGITKLYYPNRQLKREVHFKNDRKMGVDRMWNRSGVLVEECYYQDHEPYKHHRRWYSNGQMRDEKIFHGSPKLYDLVKYNYEGQLIHKGTYNPHTKEYLTQFFHPNGEEAFVEKSLWNGSKLEVLQDHNA